VSYNLRTLYFIHPLSGIIVRKKVDNHENWAEASGFKNYLNWPRGFYWKMANKLFFYYGKDTRDYARIVPEIMVHAQALLFHLNANEETIFCGGLILGKDDVLWESVQEFSNLEEFFKNRDPRTGFLKE